MNLIVSLSKVEYMEDDVNDISLLNLIASTVKNKHVRFQFSLAVSLSL